MRLLTHLLGFGLRLVSGDAAGNIVGLVEQRFRDHSRTLPKALDRAHNRAWEAIGVALAGDSVLDSVKVFLASGDSKAVREQVQQFLKSNAFSFDGTPDEYRQACLDDWKRLRKSGLLSTAGESTADIASQAASFKRHANPQGLIEEARRAVADVADTLATDFPKLSVLIRRPTQAGPPLLAAAFGYFFRREVETDAELARGLLYDGQRQLFNSQQEMLSALWQLSETQENALEEINRALGTLDGRFDALFEQLGRIEGVVLDVQAEVRGMSGDVRAIADQMQKLQAQVGMQRGEVRPGDSCSIHSEDERRAVRELLARFRQLPAVDQLQVPALLNGLGKLQVGAGDIAEARRTFTEVVQVVGNPLDKAEASYNAYRAALEEKNWDAALSALRAASSLDPQRFAPFPLHRYEPQRILGAGGFGTAILCRDRNLDVDVVIKSLHAADMARGMDEVFREARILQGLKHEAIIGARDWDYANLTQRSRPYLVMEYFPGGTLQQFLEQHGPLNLEQVLSLAVQVAEGMKAAHAQGVFHRDLKPANILVLNEGNVWKVKIIDFGLALRHQTVETSRVKDGASRRSILDWSVAGTLDYAPPEQLGKRQGVKPGAYSDVYSFAKTCCYAMFMTTELLQRHWRSLQGPLAELLEASLDPDPKKRPQCFETVLAVLLEYSRTMDEAKRRQQETRLQVEQEEELRRQREAEELLRKLVEAALDRPGGKPTADDTAAAKELCRQYKLPTERANAVIREVRERRRREREEREREQEVLETTRQHQGNQDREQEEANLRQRERDLQRREEELERQRRELEEANVRQRERDLQQREEELERQRLEQEEVLRRMASECREQEEQNRQKQIKEEKPKRNCSHCAAVMEQSELHCKKCGTIDWNQCGGMLVAGFVFLIPGCLGLYFSEAIIWRILSWGSVGFGALFPLVVVVDLLCAWGTSQQ